MKSHIQLMIIILMGIITSLITNVNAQTLSTVDTSVSEDKMFENIKRSIKPVVLKDEPISLKYESIPKAPINIKIGEAISDKILKNSLVKDATFNKENVDELIYNAYKAANLGSLEASINLYKRVIEIEPNNSNAIFSLGSIYQKLNQYDDAKLMYSKLFDLGEYSANAINNYLALISKETPSKALTQLKDLENVNPDYSPVKAQIAMIYANLGDFEMAENYLRDAILLAPEVINYRYNLAILYDKTNKHNFALQIYRQVLDLSGTELPIETINNIRNRISVLQNSLTTN